MALEKMHPVQKKQLCKNVYEEYIVESAEILKKYEMYSNTIRANLPDSCYTNFRDALFHFRKLVLASGEQELSCQEFAIKEHLSRALTDAASSVIDVITWVAENMLQDEEVLDEWKVQIRLMLHKMKNIFLRKRLAGMMISGDEIRVSHYDVEKCCDAFLKFSNDNCKDIFAKYSSQYIARTILEIEKNAYVKMARRLLSEHIIAEEEIKKMFPYFNGMILEINNQ